VSKWLAQGLNSGPQDPAWKGQIRYRLFHVYLCCDCHVTTCQYCRPFHIIALCHLSPPTKLILLWFCHSKQALSQKVITLWRAIISLQMITFPERWRLFENRWPRIEWPFLTNSWLLNRNCLVFYDVPNPTQFSKSTLRVKSALHKCRWRLLSLATIRTKQTYWVGILYSMLQETRWPPFEIWWVIISAVEMVTFVYNGIAGHISRYLKI
jgi:hypothetical protein